MTFVLPEMWVELPSTDPAALTEHAEQVQRNFEVLSRRIDTTPAPLRSVNASGEPAFENGWVNFGVNDTAAFYRDRDRVYLTGIVSTGTVNTPIFTLPVGYRPAAGRVPRFAVVSNTLSGYAYVGDTGAVVLLAGSNAWVDLSPISFRAA